MYQYLKNLYKIVNQYVPNDQCVVYFSVIHSKYKTEQRILMKQTGGAHGLGFRFHTTNTTLGNDNLLGFTIVTTATKRTSTNISKGYKKYSSFCQLCIWEARFSSCISTKTTYCNSLNAQVDMRRIQLSSIKPDLKEIWKIQYSSTVFFEKIICHKVCYLSYVTYYCYF